MYHKHLLIIGFNPHSINKDDNISIFKEAFLNIDFDSIRGPLKLDGDNYIPCSEGCTTYYVADLGFIKDKNIE